MHLPHNRSKPSHSCTSCTRVLSLPLHYCLKHSSLKRVFAVEYPRIAKR